MNPKKNSHAWARIALLSLLISLLGPAVTQARSIVPQPQDVDIQIVDDRGNLFRQYSLQNYPHGKTQRAWLEATKGKNYRVRIRNRTGHRIGLVIAVDGRNIISGKNSNLRRKEAMYVLGSYETQHYEGWRTSANKVHRFYFTDADDSYAKAFDDDSAMGVIAVAVYREQYIIRPLKKRTMKQRSDASGKRAPSAVTESADALEAMPGTGFGEEEESHSVRVEFKPQQRASMKYFLKYEWRETLCTLGVVECGRRGNRFWPDDLPGRAYDTSYVPYPPGYVD